MKKVNAATIIQTTCKAAGAPVPQMPAVKKLIDDIRARLSVSSDDIVAETRRKERLADLDNFIQRCPDGFILTPVLYTRISHEENTKVQTEYSFHVRPRFLRFLAASHAGDLRALGVCDAGIQRMAQGLDPTDETGRLYDISIDHIIERSGGGSLSRDKTRDLQQDAKAVFGANHFANLIFLPEQVHQYKNALNTLQGIGEVCVGESRWLLMMVPAPKTGHVCPPQQKGHVLAGLALRGDDPQKRIGHTAFVCAQTAENIWAMHKNSKAAAIVFSQMKAANDHGLSVAEVAEIELGQKKNKLAGGLHRAFSRAIAQEPALLDHVNNVLRPGVDESRRQLRDTFNQLSDNYHRRAPNAQAHYDAFVKFYKGRNMGDLRTEAGKYPFSESVALLRECRRIDTEVATTAAARERNRHKRKDI